MRILHVIGSLDPADGGPPVIVSRLAAAQAVLGHDVTLMTYDTPEGRRYWEASRPVLPGGDQVRVVHVPPGGGLERVFGGAARRAARELMGGCDVVHLHSVWESILRVTAEEARAEGVPYTILLNGMLDTYQMQRKALKKRLAMALGYRRMLNGASALHMGNEVERRNCAPLGLDPPPLIVPNGITFAEIDPLPEPGSFRARHPELGDHPYILFLSRLHYKKGLDYLADAFVLFSREEPDTHLVVAGPDGGMQAEFEQTIASAGITDRVHVVGPLYGRDKNAAFHDAACFCLPTRQEGFTVVVNETLACGVPMVISEGAHRPDVGDADAGIIVELTARNVADALLRMMGDEALRTRMGRNGRAHAERDLTWEAVARTMLEAYASFPARS